MKRAAAGPSAPSMISSASNFAIFFSSTLDQPTKRNPALWLNDWFDIVIHVQSDLSPFKLSDPCTFDYTVAFHFSSFETLGIQHTATG